VTTPKDSTAAENGPKRLIFLSHAVADRKLADALKAAALAAYSGVVDVFASSDTSVGGGLKPGDEWFATIHEHLQIAEAVWVLATPTSLKHPWLYWEAGIGQAVC